MNHSVQLFTPIIRTPKHTQTAPYIHTELNVQTRPGPHCHKERGTTIGGVLPNPGFKRRMGGGAALRGMGRVGFIPPGCRHQGSARCLRLPIVWGKMGNPQDKPVSSFWGPIWICPFLLLSFKNQKCKDLKRSMNFISGST